MDSRHYAYRCDVTGGQLEVSFRGVSIGSGSRYDNITVFYLCDAGDAEEEAYALGLVAITQTTHRRVLFSFKSVIWNPWNDRSGTPYTVPAFPMMDWNNYLLCNSPVMNPFTWSVVFSESVAHPSSGTSLGSSNYRIGKGWDGDGLLSHPDINGNPRDAYSSMDVTISKLS